MLLLSRFSRIRPRATPEMAAHQAPPSLGFSRQEHWSGLPFPSPMHESEKWKKSLSRVQLFATPWTAAYQAPLSMGFSRQEYWSGVPLPSPLWEPSRLQNSEKWMASQCLGVVKDFTVRVFHTEPPAIHQIQFSFPHPSTVSPGGFSAWLFSSVGCDSLFLPISLSKFGGSSFTLT